MWYFTAFASSALICVQNASANISCGTTPPPRRRDTGEIIVSWVKRRRRKVDRIGRPSNKQQSRPPTDYRKSEALNNRVESLRTENLARHSKNLSYDENDRQDLTDPPRPARRFSAAVKNTLTNTLHERTLREIPRGTYALRKPLATKQHCQRNFCPRG